MKWKLLTTFNGTSSSNIFSVDMTQYKEVLAVFEYTNTEGGIIKYSVLVRTLNLLNERKSYRTGAYQNSSANQALFAISLSKTEVAFTTYNAYFNGNNVGSSTVAKVYVR